ncbi:uncharacterized protein J3D65DRAFT_634841 [Phyllosticta citribraziliensis]|uniref:Transmembrane protein n=1 Tax=Phyllosticta citribraziliensis TaxID=989973 RepID=A0ABR1LDC5_9PEZI
MAHRDDRIRPARSNSRVMAQSAFSLLTHSEWGEVRGAFFGRKTGSTRRAITMTLEGMLLTNISLFLPFKCLVFSSFMGNLGGRGGRTDGLGGADRRLLHDGRHGVWTGFCLLVCLVVRRRKDMARVCLFSCLLSLLFFLLLMD